jgi:DNA-binding transcriptional MocR family regulator
MTSIRTTQIDLTTGLINFGIGQPGFDLLPLDIMRRASELRLSQGDTELLNYGYEQGDGYFRLALARFLEQGYGCPVTADSLFITAGASQALDLICTLFTKPGDTVFVEEPSYFLALRIFADHHLNLISLPTDENGLIMAALEEALARHHPIFLYTIPTCQNPTGATLPADRRRHLLALSQQHDFLIVADEVYQLLSYDDSPPLPFAAAIADGKVLSVGSFSKILAPGLRLGWVQAASPLVERLFTSGLVDSGGGLNHFTSNIVRVVLEQGWQESHLAHLQTVYRKRLQVMEKALQDHLGDVVRFVTPQGGFFFWLALADEVDTAVLLSRAQQYQVGYQPGIKFSSQQGLHNYLRLCFAFYDEAMIVEGIERLGLTIK